MGSRLFRLWLAAENLIIPFRIDSSGLIVIADFPALISKLIGLMFGIVPAVQMALRFLRSMYTNYPWGRYQILEN